MSLPRMHADEVATDGGLVRQLLAEQFPEWSGLPIHHVESSGTDHALYRLGDDMCVRLPRIPSAATQVAKEQRWLPVLAPHLPLEVPAPLGLGRPGHGFPWHWSVYSWLAGETLTASGVDDDEQLALDLAHFVAALRRVDASEGPPPGDHNFGRGENVAVRDEETRAAMVTLRGVVDVGKATAAWEQAIAAPPWQGQPTWVHGDLQGGNLLTRDRRVRAVIDFGGLGAGDPACDVMVAWALLDPGPRAVFRAALDVDDAMWARARGWALTVALVALPYYWDTNPALVALARRSVAAVEADPDVRG